MPGPQVEPQAKTGHDEDRSQQSHRPKSESAPPVPGQVRHLSMLQKSAGNQATVALLARQAAQHGGERHVSARYGEGGRHVMGSNGPSAPVSATVPLARTVAERLPGQARVDAAQRTFGQEGPASRISKIAGGAPAHRVHRCCVSKTPKVKDPEGSQEVGNSLPDKSVADITSSDSRDVHPQAIANALSNELPAFKELRGQADAKVKEVFGEDKDFTYGPKPKKGGGTAPAYYKDGSAYFGSDVPHISQTVLNVIFETANAAQADRFAAVETADDKGQFGGSSFDIARWVDHSEELGGLVDEATDSFSRRSLVQEYYEWQSFQLAKASFAQYQPMITDKDNTQGVSAQLIWDTSFGAVLKCKNFLEYYKVFGKTHRAAVEGALRRAGK